VTIIVRYDHSSTNPRETAQEGPQQRKSQAHYQDQPNYSLTAHPIKASIGTKLVYTNQA
jgi:hypothetical protein